MRYNALIPLIAAVPSTLAALSTERPELANTTTLPTHFAMLLLPEFQALDVIGPLDVLNTLAMFYKNDTKMHLSMISRSMDPVATTNRTGKGWFGQDMLPTTTFQEVLANGGKCPASSDSGAGRGQGTGEGKGVVEEQSGGYSQGGGENGGKDTKEMKETKGGYGNSYSRRDEKPADKPADSPTEGALGEVEVLLVPGGAGTRRDVTQEIEFVKAMYPKLKYIISICTGSTLMARAGILDGKSATTNKRAWAWAVSTGPNVNWVPTARWVEDGNIWSSSGISAGIDVTFAWIAKVYGEEVSSWIAASMEYERWTDAHRDPFADIWGAGPKPVEGEPAKPTEAPKPAEHKAE